MAGPLLPGFKSLLYHFLIPAPKLITPVASATSLHGKGVPAPPTAAVPEPEMACESHHIASK
jgi:hypothetical protein